MKRSGVDVAPEWGLGVDAADEEGYYAVDVWLQHDVRCSCSQHAEFTVGHACSNGTCVAGSLHHVNMLSSPVACMNNDDERFAGDWRPCNPGAQPCSHRVALLRGYHHLTCLCCWSWLMLTHHRVSCPWSWCQQERQHNNTA